MAITAHWVQSVTVEHPSGPPTEELVLRADLVGFHHLPGHHTGKHMAQLFLFVTDRIGVTLKVNIIHSSIVSLLITNQIGWVTLDNASNNDTLMYHLELLLRGRGIPFDRVQRRIRYVVCCSAPLTLILLQVLPSYH
jgi:hypothetical protein